MKTQILFAAALALSVSACGDPKPAASKQKPATANSGDDTTGSGGTTGNGSIPAGSTDILASWCKKANETNAVKAHMTDVFGKLCNGNQPTALFAQTLINTAYAGSGTPQLQSLKLSTVGPNTTGDFGVGIKMPISAQDHFTKVGPKGGDPNSVKVLATAQGATGQAELLKTYKKGDDKYLERGWQLHAKTTKRVFIVDKTQDSNNDSMQYDFGENGKSFMYAQYIVRAIEGISAYNLLTACVQIGNDSYLLTAAHVTVDNTPGGTLAEAQVKEAAEKVVASQFKSAQDAR